ncbi:MAG: DUF3108 domain-containing protein [Rhodomicrobium sp.]
MSKYQGLAREPEIKHKFFRIALALAALFAPPAFLSPAKAEVFVSRYDVRLAGMHMGEAIIHTALGAKRYKVAVSADVGALFINERIQSEVTGSRLGSKLTPEHFVMVMSGGEDRAVEIQFKGSAPPSMKFSPPLEELADRPPPLKAADLRGVLDPLSALLTASLKLAPSSNPCTSVLPIFMGQMRFDIHMHQSPAAQAQREPGVAVCQAQYIPIGDAAHAGEGGQFPAPEAVFVRLAKPNVWLLHRLSLPTPVGTVTVDRAETAVTGS